LEASGENILFGGAPGTADFGAGGLLASQSPIVPSDIEIINNYFFKPLRWKVGDPSFAGIHWSVKNLLELKNSQRVLIDGNIFENNWQDQQTGHAIVMTPRYEGGVMANARDIEITVRNNIVLHSGSAFSNIAVDSSEVSGPLRSQNIAYINNLVIDMNSQPLTSPNGANGEGGDWRIFGDPGLSPVDGLPGRGTANVTIDHNTGLGDTRFMNCNGGERNFPGFVMTNNLLNFGSPSSTVGAVGFKCSGTGFGTGSLQSVFPGFVFSTNVIANNLLSPASWPGANQTCSASNATCFPSDFVAAGMIDFSNCDAGLFDPSKCALNVTSPYHAAASDGKDIGVDITKLPLTGVRP
jgi:hypothetical protein